ncbi:DUF5916 domain-containing protein, partial [Gemmatimonadota bacterium]
SRIRACPSRGVESESWSTMVAANLRWRPSGRADLSLGPFFSRNLNDLQWVRKFALDEDHFLFGRIDQKTLGLTGRLDFTFTPDLTLQVYAQPFVAAGAYSQFKQLGDPRAKRYEDRFVGVGASLDDGSLLVDLDGDGETESFGNPDFNFKQFRSTMVLRWEYRPGSLLYVVWSQGRDHSGEMGQLNFGESLGDLFSQPGENVFMVKLSYWITP